MIRAWLIGGLALLYVPLVVLVAGSFNANRLATSWGGFSLHWYELALASATLRDAALLSFRVALISSALATILGGLAGHALARRRMRGREGFATLLAAPLVLPDLLIGFSFVLLFVILGVPRGAATIVLAHATIGMAYVAVVVEAHLAQTGTMLEDAARDLGASEWGALLRVTLPLAAPALAAGFLLSFTLSLDDLVVASFVSGPGATTLPMVMFSALRLGATPALAAIATMLLIAVLVCLAGFVMLTGEKTGLLFRRKKQAKQ